jgi:hypothetical protein
VRRTAGRSASMQPAVELKPHLYPEEGGTAQVELRSAIVTSSALHPNGL